MVSSRNKRGFTLIELLVVIAIIALLLAILMPALTMAKKIARTVICRTQLRSLGMYFKLYSDENNGFPVENGRGSGTTEWKAIIHHYVLSANKKSNIYVCPSAKKSSRLGGFHPFRAWNDKYDDPDPIKRLEPMVSYGLNRWTYNYSDSGTGPSSLPYKNRWRRPEDAGSYGSMAPLLGDALNDGGMPHNGDTALVAYEAFKNSSHPKNISQAYMHNFTAGRHPKETANFVFLDMSVGTVKMQDLWNLKWHKEFKPHVGPAGGFPQKEVDGDVDYYN